MKTHKETIEAARRLVEEKPELYQALADSESGETLTPEEQELQRAYEQAVPCEVRNAIQSAIDAVKLAGDISVDVIVTDTDTGGSVRMLSGSCDASFVDADIAAPESKLRELSRLSQEFGAYDTEADEKLREESFVRAMTCCSRGPCSKHRQ